MSRASSTARWSASPVGTTRFASPMRWASSVLAPRPVRMRSSASLYGVAGGDAEVAPGGELGPPATAWPSTGSDHRLGQQARGADGASPCGRCLVICSGSRARIALRSAPAQDVPGAGEHGDGELVVGVEFDRATTSALAAGRSTASAATSGRSIVMTTTGGRRSIVTVMVAPPLGRARTAHLRPRTAERQGSSAPPGAGRPSPPRRRRRRSQADQRRVASPPSTRGDTSAARRWTCEEVVAPMVGWGPRAMAISMGSLRRPECS